MGNKKNKKELERIKNKHNNNKLNNSNKNVEKIVNEDKLLIENNIINKDDIEIDGSVKEEEKKEDNTLDNDIMIKDVSNKIKNKKKITRIILIVLLSVLLSLLTITLINYIDMENREKERLENIRRQNEEIRLLVEEINSHYNNVVKTNKDAEIYDDEGNVIGIIYEGIELELEEIEIDKDTKYFKISKIDGYIKYQDVEKKESKTIYDDRYKNYIVFNLNIITNDITSFYDEELNKIYTYNKSFDLPIIIKDTDKYGVEFNDRLLYVKTDDVKEVKYNYNTNRNNASGVGVFNYHAFYDEENYEEKKACNTMICHSKKQFKIHLDYFKKHNILTLKAHELEDYIDGKIRLPKSILITIDDGPKTEHAVNMLTEYKMYATIFLITDWFDEKTYYKTEYIELHSHGHDLHNQGVCPGGQGGGIKCLPRDVLLKDLKESSMELGGSKYFCYPFYEYNNYSISVLKEAGYTMAFAGEYGDMLTKVGRNKYTIPRFVITIYTTLNDINNYLNQIRV